MLRLHHNVLRRILHFLFFALGRIEVVGLENIPLSGGILQASNHLSWLDGPLIYSILPREDVTALAAEKYRRNLISRWLLDSARVLWLDRDNPDPRALKDAIRFMKDGGLLGMAPEGTRSKTGGLIKDKAGVSFLALRAGVPIQAVAVTGTPMAFPELFRFRRPHLRVEFSVPFELQAIDRKNRDEGMAQNADEIMCRIARMLPQEYRGVYAEHPRLKELLSD